MIIKAFSVLTALLVSTTASAFSPVAPSTVSRRPRAATTAATGTDAVTAATTSIIVCQMTQDDTGKAPLMDLPATTNAKQILIDTAERLKDEYGLFLIDTKAQNELTAAVEELESRSEPPGFHEWRSELVGTWELVCTTATPSSSSNGMMMPLDTSKIPFYDFSPLKNIRDSIRKTTNKYLKVQQQIIPAKSAKNTASSSSNDNGGSSPDIERVDYILQYEPPAELQDVLDNLPGPLSTLDINPLHVSRSQLTLQHKANVSEDDDEDLQIQLRLEKIVLNVAGTSTFLDPNGKDLAGVNLPLGDFLNAGTFQTTYMDKELRISRGKQGFVDVLRVFVRPGRVEKDAILRDIIKEENDTNTKIGMDVDAEADVDDFVDSEFEDNDDDDNIAPSDVEEEQ